MWLLVAHAYTPSYSGGRDQEDCGSRPAWAGMLRNPISGRSKMATRVLKQKA
jgi:hypothetical protein